MLLWSWSCHAAARALLLRQSLPLWCYADGKINIFHVASTLAHTTNKHCSTSQSASSRPHTLNTRPRLLCVSWRKCNHRLRRGRCWKWQDVCRPSRRRWWRELCYESIRTYEREWVAFKTHNTISGCHVKLTGGKLLCGDAYCPKSRFIKVP